jgi:DnaJ-class molecular chaperone
MRDPYKVLGVGRTAGQDEIKRAYRRLARELHPDVDPGNPWGAEEFKEVTAAYALLSDPAKRAAYDRGEIDADGNPCRPAAGAGGGRRRGNDPFARFRQKKNAGTTVRVDGADVSYTLKVGFADAILGNVSRITTATGRTLEVRIPPGADGGRVLRLRGQGMPGMGGGLNGDALVEICVEPHPILRRQGDDIHMDLPVGLREAVLGTRIEVPTLDGPVMMTVPEGANTDTVLRLRGKGVPNGQGRGDQYVTLKVMLPPRPDPELADFVRHWAGAAYEVRRKEETDPVS